MSDLRRTGKNLLRSEREARARFIASRIEQGAGLDAIAAELGLHKKTLRMWWAEHLRGPIDKPKPKPTEERPMRACCVPSCGAQFLTERAAGAWLRMCPDCRRRAASGVVFHSIAHDGRKGRAR